MEIASTRLRVAGAGVPRRQTTNISTNERIDMDNAMNELWRAQQDAATRLTESWRTLLQPAADGTARPPAPAQTDDPTQQLVDTDPGETTDSDTTDSDTTGEVTEPEPEPEPSALDAFQAIHALRDGQRDLAQHMTRWAELQRDLADTTTAWASRQRDHADALDRVLAPFSAGTVERPV
jgi:hypothetical protein